MSCIAVGKFYQAAVAKSDTTMRSPMSFTATGGVHRRMTSRDGQFPSAPVFKVTRYSLDGYKTAVRFIQKIFFTLIQ